jgi:glutaredoxin 2
VNTKRTLADSSIYISIISIVKEKIHRGQESTLDYIILPPRLLKEEINTLSTCKAQIVPKNKKDVLLIEFKTLLNSTK